MAKVEGCKLEELGRLLEDGPQFLKEHPEGQPGRQPPWKPTKAKSARLFATWKRNPVSFSVNHWSVGTPAR